MSRPRLLIIDDEEGLRSSLSLLLEDEGYDVETADSGDTGLTAAGDRSFDLVLCDVRMPGRNGLEILPELVERQPCASVLMMSAYGSTVVGAPVELCRERVRNGRARGVVVNSGIANVAMGARGGRDASEMARLAAAALGVPEQEMLVLMYYLVMDRLF